MFLLYAKNENIIGRIELKLKIGLRAYCRNIQIRCCSRNVCSVGQIETAKERGH